MRGRTVPPVVIEVTAPRAGDPSQDVDAAFFERNPDTHEYMRDYIPGETVEPLPPGTWVLVARVNGNERVRGFAPPAAGWGAN